MITNNLFADKTECCGCGICAENCPQHLIDMQYDKEGFLYPYIIDPVKCTDCKKCVLICPMKNVGIKTTDFIAFYAGYFMDDRETISCSSGGFATALSYAFIKNGGIVYGGAYSGDLKSAVHKRVDSLENVCLLKGSKYIQTDKRDIYSQMKRDLSCTRPVLFIGLPCEVAAVKQFFKRYENLYTVELVCHGPTSSKVHRQYCEDLEKKYKSKIKTISVRYKLNGNWKPYYIHAEFENGKSYNTEFLKSIYGMAFKYMKRPSCYKCNVKGNHLQGDIMIGDYHYATKNIKGYNVHGVSSILVHNKRGMKLLDFIDESFYIFEIPKHNAISNAAIYKASDIPYFRTKFRKTFIEYGLQKAGELSAVKIEIFARNVIRKIKSAIVKFIKKTLR